jgi:hypothetical protein
VGAGDVQRQRSPREFEGRDVDLDDGTQTSVGYMEITGESDIGIEDLQRGRDENGGTDVLEAILAALIDGERPSREVKAQVVNELSCSKRTVERAAVGMERDGDLMIASGGFPRTTTWALPSSDTTRLPVATNTNTTLVATAEATSLQGFSLSSSDSSDTPARDVAAVPPPVPCVSQDGGDDPDEHGRCSRCFGWPEAA